MIPYRVYYDDGTTSENEVTYPWRVVCIAQPWDKIGREVVHGYPYYIRVHERWRGLDDATSVIQQLMFNLPAISQVAMGIWVGEQEWIDIYRRAREDDGLPRRSNEEKDRRR